jgi:hypothetical protein
MIADGNLTTMEIGTSLNDIVLGVSSAVVSDNFTEIQFSEIRNCYDSCTTPSKSSFL